MNLRRISRLPPNPSKRTGLQIVFCIRTDNFLLRRLLWYAWKITSEIELMQFAHALNPRKGLLEIEKDLVEGRFMVCSFSDF